MDWRVVSALNGAGVGLVCGVKGLKVAALGGAGLRHGRGSLVAISLYKALSQNGLNKNCHGPAWGAFYFVSGVLPRSKWALLSVKAPLLEAAEPRSGVPRFDVRCGLDVLLHAMLSALV